MFRALADCFLKCVQSSELTEKDKQEATTIAATYNGKAAELGKRRKSTRLTRKGVIMKIDFNKILIGLDTYTSYVPGLSTVTNLVDLALKALFRGGKEAPASSYRRHIQSKVVKDCALLLIPVIGNILVPALNSPKKRGQYYEKMGDTSKAIEEYTKGPRRGCRNTHFPCKMLQ